MTNSGRGSENGGARSHRRVDPDELTLDDLFRPEPRQPPPQTRSDQPPGQPEYYSPVQQEPDQQPAPGSPWQPSGHGPVPGPSQAPGSAPGGGVTPQQGRPWGAPPVSRNPAGAADETQLISPYQAPPGTGPVPGAGAPAGGGPDETRQIPQDIPPAPPRPVEPPRTPPRPQDGPQGAASSPFTIRPGLPGGAYGEGPSYAAPAGPDGSDRTQVLPPVPAGGTTPPPRGYGGAPGPAASVPPPAYGDGRPSPYGTPSEPSPAPARPRSRRASPGRSGKKLSPVALAGIVVAGCAVAGLVAGAALSGDSGSGGEQEDPAAQKAAATSSAPPEGTAGEDPAKAQAKDLDALLEDSNNSRSAVITAVEQIKRCRNLDGAAESLRDAAAQRNDLVSRLAGLPVDKLADHKRLTAALNKAWASSASADNHYASWADDVAGRKGCKKGQARITRHAQQGNRASGDATRAKREAARLWNALAARYGLTERTATQL